jgi:hypothetical protein
MNVVLLTVCTDTQVDLLLEAILLEGLGDTKNGIRRAFLDTGPCGRVHTGDAKDLLLTDCGPGHMTKCGEHDDEGLGRERWNSVQEKQAREALG